MTLSGFLEWLENSPPSAMVNASEIGRTLRELGVQQSPSAEPVPPAQVTWRERLWSVPAETRLNVLQAAEALGRPKSFVYRHTSEKAAGNDRLPHRRLDGELVFVASELRSWLVAHEETVHAAPAARAALSIQRGSR